MLNQFKVGLRKEIMKDVGVLLLREEELTLEKAEELAKYQETATKMMQGRVVQALQVTCYTCGKVGHVSRDCREKQYNMKIEARPEGRRDREQDSRRRNGCYLCQGLDHWARDCPNRCPKKRMPSNRYGNNVKGQTEDRSPANVVMEKRDARSNAPQDKRHDESYHDYGNQNGRFDQQGLGRNSRSWTGGLVHQDAGYNRPNGGSSFGNRNTEHAQRDTTTRSRVSWEEDRPIRDAIPQTRQPSQSLNY